MWRVSMRCAVALVSGALVSGASAQTDLIAHFKQIGAPPEDVERGWLRPPRPEAHGAVGRCRQLSFVGTGAPLEVSFSVPRSELLTIIPIGDPSEGWSVDIFRPDGERMSDAARTVRDALAPYGTGEALRFDVTAPDAGVWTVRLDGVGQGQKGLLMVRDALPVALRSTRNTWRTVAREPFELRASFESTDEQARSINLVSTSARLLGGGDLSVARAGDEVIVPLSLPAGDHIIWIDAVGLDIHSGYLLERSVLHHVHIEEDPIEFEPRATTAVLDEHRIRITIPCAHGRSREAVLGGAEVWTAGIDAECMAWIGGMIPLDEDGAHFVLDTRWLAGVPDDLVDIELRNVRVADRDSCVLLGERSGVALGLVSVSRTPIDASAAREMRMGRGDQGGSLISVHPRAVPGGHNLMLVHGYCYSGNPDNAWASSQFTGDVARYLNIDQNFSHDEFALDILSYGNQFKSYSIAGHSQGGTAGLHLYSFYWSGLDWATPSPAEGGRLVQALGTPFQGTPLAGNIAALGEIFGIQCGANYDMTYDGAAYWLSFLPGWSREATWSWTTSFSDDSWWWDYCHIAADLILSDPEDGTVESFSGQLDGANYMGMKEGWCHISNMADPAHVLDTVRNAEIDTEAAR